MWEKLDLETIFTSNDVNNIQDVIGKGFRYTEIAYSVGVNYYFIPVYGKPDHMQHLTMDQINISLKFIITDRNIVLEKN